MLETSLLYDLPNLFVCLLTVLIVSAWAKLPKQFVFILILHCFVPFFLNDFLFSPSYMPDQFRYQANVFNIRNALEFSESSNTVLNSSYMLSYLPLPLVMTIKSLGFFNKFLIIIAFGFLYKKKILNDFSAYFFLLYPSFALYSGLSLRDTLVTFFMITSTFFAYRKNLLLFCLCLYPLYLIKFQNFVIMLPLAFYIIFDIGKKGMSIKVGISVCISLFVGLISLFPVLIPAINKHHFNMFIDDGGKIENVVLINGLGDFVASGLSSAFYFLMKPFPWEASSLMQIIQSVENFILLFLIYKVTKLAWLNGAKHLVFWVLFFLISMSIYGLVVFNYGTSARYRFPFIVIYVIFVCHSCGVKGIRDKK